MIPLTFLCDSTDSPPLSHWLSFAIPLTFLGDFTDFPPLSHWLFATIPLTFLGDSTEFPLWFHWLSSVIPLTFLCDSTDFPPLSHWLFATIPLSFCHVSCSMFGLGLRATTKVWLVGKNSTARKTSAIIWANARHCQSTSCPFFPSFLTSSYVVFFVNFFANFFLICVASSCRAAFQYGVKMKDGRKQGKSSSKSEKSKLNSEWNKISALIQKRKDGGEARYVYTTWYRAVHQLMQSSVPARSFLSVVHFSPWLIPPWLIPSWLIPLRGLFLRGLLFYRFPVIGRVGLHAITNILIWGSTCDFAGVFVCNGYISHRFCLLLLYSGSGKRTKLDA